MHKDPGRPRTQKGRQLTVDTNLKQTPEQKAHRRDRKDLRSALGHRERADTIERKTAAESRAASIILRPLFQAAYEDITSANLAELAQGLKVAAESGTYDGGCYGDSYSEAIEKIGSSLGIDTKAIPKEVHDRIRRLV